MTKSHQRVFAAAAFAAAAFLSGSGVADEAQLRPARTVKADAPASRTSVPVGLTLDFARILAFDSPARTVIIGNPNIVDGTLSDEHTIVLTGKAIGTTNMIVLGDSGQEVANLAISVSVNGHQVTTVYHGTEMQIFSCSETCRPVPTIVGK